MFQNKSIRRSCWSPVTSRHLNSFGEITRILLNWLNSGPTDMCCVMILGPTGGSSVGSASGPTCCYRFEIILLGQWLNFKLLFRITYLVGKLKLISVISGFPLGWVIQSNQKKKWQWKPHPQFLGLCSGDFFFWSFCPSIGKAMEKQIQDLW